MHKGKPSGKHLAMFCLKQIIKSGKHVAKTEEKKEARTCNSIRKCENEIQKS